MTSRTTVAPSSGTRSRTAPVPSSSPRKPRLPCALLERLDLVGAGGRAVGVAGGEQLLDDLGVAVGALGLEDRLAVPVEPEPVAARRRSARRSRASSARGRCPRCAARARAAVAAGQQPVVQCRPRAADVQGAGRRRSEPHAHGGHSMPPNDERPDPMLIGAHVSPAGGPANAVERGVERGCQLDPDLQPEPAPWKPRVYSRRGGRRVPRGDGRPPTSTRC